MTKTTPKTKTAKAPQAKAKAKAKRITKAQVAARSEAGRLLQSFRKNFGAGPGRNKIDPPTSKPGPWEDRFGQACQLRIAGASLQWIGDQMGVSRQRVLQLIRDCESRHPGLYARVREVFPPRKRTQAA